MRIVQLVVPLAFLLISFQVNAQDDIRFGVSAGLSHYQGDLSPGDEGISLGRTRNVFGAFVRFNHDPILNTRIGLFYGQVEGSDADSPLPDHQSRNLSFQSNIVELSIIEEVNLPGFDPFGNKRFSPYLFGGIGVYYFNPKTEYLGQMVDLQPLGTEGQGISGYPEPYQRIQVAFPFGGGLKVAVSDKLTLSAEIGGRKLLTDYLDDVSGSYVDYQLLLAENGELAAALGNRTGEFLGTEPILTTNLPRGGERYNDWYFFSTVSLAFNITGDGAIFNSNRYGCPTF